MAEKRKIWIEAGFHQFARFGPEGLKIDRLAAAVNKSRSSFYHLFGDMEGFLYALFDHYWNHTRYIAEQLESAEYFYPDFAQLLEQNKDWAFTHIQLYHHRERSEEYLYNFNRGTELIEKKIGKLWAKMAGLDQLPIEQTLYPFRVLREAMFSKLHYDTFSPELLHREMREFTSSLEFLLDGKPS
jgi:AcrR family transcriptional regulator